MSETAWTVIAFLGLAVIIFLYLGFTTWLDRKYPYVPPARRERTRATPPPMWTSTTTTWTKGPPPKKSEPKEGS